MKHHTRISALVVALMLSLSACGTDSASPSPSTSPSPSATVAPDSENSGDITQPENSVDAGDKDPMDSLWDEDSNDRPDSAQDDRPGSAPDDRPDSAQENSAAEAGENASDHSAAPRGGDVQRDLEAAGDDLGSAARSAGQDIRNMT